MESTSERYCSKEHLLTTAACFDIFDHALVVFVVVNKGDAFYNDRASEKGMAALTSSLSWI
jgi:hypothetical protein